MKNGNINVKDQLQHYYVSTGQAGGASISPEFRDYVRRTLYKILSKGVETKILEIGCGSGALVEVLNEYPNIRCEGVDISPEQIALGAKLDRSVRLGDALTELRTYPSFTYDAILALDVLEHLELEYLVDLLTESARVLKAGGCLIARVPNAESFAGVAIHFSDLTHERAFTDRSIRQLFALTEGWSSIEVGPSIAFGLGFKSVVRRLVWIMLRFPQALSFWVEVGRFPLPQTRNMIVRAFREN